MEIAVLTDEQIVPFRDATKGVAKIICAENRRGSRGPDSGSREEVNSAPVTPCKGLGTRGEFMLTKTEEWVLIVSMVAMAVLGGYQVVTRYVFTSLALIWIEELIRHLFIVVTYIGAAAVMRKKGHPAVEAFAQILPSRLKTYHELKLASVPWSFQPPQPTRRGSWWPNKR
jgi:hypothetical protein